MENQVEIWKAHPDIAGIEVSTLGRVRTLDMVVSSEKRTQFTKGRVLKRRDNGKGYLQVQFRVNGKKVHELVHRLVAQTFLSNPNGFPMVNHRDCNRKNNKVDNLEFCTASYNNQYRENFGEAFGKPVYAVNLSTFEALHFRSQTEASRLLGIDRRYINKVIRGRIKKTCGYWFVNADDNAIDIAKRKIREIGKTKLASSDAAIAEFIRQVNNF